MHCWHMGHSEALCTVHNPELRTLDKGKQVKRVYVPKDSRTDSPNLTRIATAQDDVSIALSFASTVLEPLLISQEVGFPKTPVIVLSDDTDDPNLRATNP